jgi:Leucine-rich repeat (LRR) protein
MLKQINLSKNSLSEVAKELVQLKQLNHLDLSCNKITQINDFIEGLNCVEINLNENQIKNISPNISKCPRLKVIRLEQNILEIDSIPHSLLSDSQVALISIDGNLFNQKQFEKLPGYDKVCSIYVILPW